MNNAARDSNGNVSEVEHDALIKLEDRTLFRVEQRALTKFRKGPGNVNQLHVAP